MNTTEGQKKNWGLIASKMLAYLAITGGFLFTFIWLQHELRPADNEIDVLELTLRGMIISAVALWTQSKIFPSWQKTEKEQAKDLQSASRNVISSFAMLFTMYIYRWLKNGSPFISQESIFENVCLMSFCIFVGVFISNLVMPEKKKTRS